MSILTAGSDSFVFAEIHPLSFTFLDHGGVLQIQPLPKIVRYVGHLFITYFVFTDYLSHFQYLHIMNPNNVFSEISGSYEPR